MTRQPLPRRRTAAQAAKSAERKNRRNARRWPLLPFAGLLEDVTAHDMARDEQAFRDRMARTTWMFHEQARLVRRRVAGLVTAQELADLDQRRKIYPRDPVYAVEHWRAQLNRLLGGMEEAKQ